MQNTVQYTEQTRESCPAVAGCGLKSMDPTQVPPGLTHTATEAIMIIPVSDELPR